MNNMKPTLNSSERVIFEHLFEDVFEMIAWECGATETSLARDGLREVIKRRLEQILLSELAAFQVRLSSLISCDLNLPQHINLYGSKPYISNDEEEQGKLIDEWFETLKQLNLKKTEY